MKIIFSDIDGTFIKNGYIPEENIEAIKALKKGGHRFVLVSGRGVGQIEEVLEKGKFDCDYIFGNGAGYKIIGEEPILEYFIDKGEYDRWEKVLKDNDAFYCMHTDIGIVMQYLEDLKYHFDYLQNVYLQKYGREMMQHLKEKKENYYQKKAILVKNPFQYLRDNPEVKLLKFELLNGQENIREKIKEIAIDFGYLAYSSVRINLEIVPSKSNKGNAITKYLSFFNNIEETYGFGDAMNDLAMFEVVDVAISMKEANNEVKEVCDIVLDEEMGSYILREIV